MKNQIDRTIVNRIKPGWLVALAMLMTSFNVFAENHFRLVNPISRSFDHLVVFSGEAKFTPDFPGLGGILVGGFGGGNENFQKNVMKRTDEEIEENRQEAINFFQTKFGIDANDSANILFFGFEIDPRTNLRMIVQSRAFVPRRGFKIREGGWGIAVLNPDGVPLGGDFEGTLPAGAFLAFGEYNIKRPHRRNMIIKFQSDIPIISNGTDITAVRYKISNNRLGEGIEQNTFTLTELEDGQISYLKRSVLTFSADRKKRQKRYLR